VLSVPALTLQLKKSSPESLQLLQKNGIVNRSVKLLSHEQQLKIHFNALEGSYALCLTANLVHLVSIMSKEEFASVDLLSLLFVVTRLLESCGQVRSTDGGLIVIETTSGGGNVMKE
jgi:ubiquitin-protein ligase E3 B